MKYQVSICLLLIAANCGIFVNCKHVSRSGKTHHQRLINAAKPNGNSIDNGDLTTEVSKSQPVAEELPVETEITGSHNESAREPKQFFSPDELLNTMAQYWVHYYLFTKKNPKVYQQLKIDDSSSVKGSYFNSSHPTVFVTHGWTNDANSLSCTLVRDAYLAGEEDINVIVVDWSGFSKHIYPYSAVKVKRAGIQIARMIGFLKENANLRLNSTTLVGHSLGAHVVGIAGRKTDGIVDRIFALDPAHPMFWDEVSEDRVSHRCARHVQAIHTNAGKLGLMDPVGDSDFYPNGGKLQPGCFMDFITGGCSHGRAVEYFAESLNTPVDFRGRKCLPGEDVTGGRCTGDVAIMGGRSSRIEAEGVYFLMTHESRPFAVDV